MSKRTRTLETLASLPYSTVEGGKWLKKALDPADIEVEISGLPDTTTNPRCVLNYQFQGDIPVPHSNTYVANTNQSYDVDFYVFQNPVTLGMSVSRPAGTKNPIGVPISWNSSSLQFRLPPGYSLATVQTFENPQIEGDTKNQKLDSLERYCQRYRMLYGAVQCIPACSALFDSGTIEATQQIFSPEHKSINDNLTMQPLEVDENNTQYTAYRYLIDNKVHHCQRFEKNDFPDEGSSIQNATSLFCRYKEGLYMPYKIRNPLVYEYKGSEQRVYTEAPYVITDTIYFRYSSNNKYAVVAGTIDPENNTITCPQTQTAPETVMMLCYSKTGVPFYITMSTQQIPSEFTLPDVLPVYNSKTLWGIGNDGMGITGVTNFFHIEGGDFKLNMNNSTDIVHFNSTVADIPVHDTNIGIICFRSIGLQASVRVIFRFGLEMMITAGGVYTPFKHKAPKYDQKALNSYIRAVHNMRDAFLGNAATPEGHALFSAHIAEIVASEDVSYISNQGSRWYGAVSV